MRKRSEPVPALLDDEDDITKPHDLPVMSNGGLDAPATGADIMAVWERVDKVRRSRRDSEQQASKTLKSMSFKIKVIWGVGALLLAGVGASLSGAPKLIYSRGVSETEIAISVKTLIKSDEQNSARIRLLEDTMLKLLQRLEDKENSGSRRRDRDAVTQPSPRGDK